MAFLLFFQAFAKLKAEIFCTQRKEIQSTQTVFVSKNLAKLSRFISKEEWRRWTTS